jgi:peptide/nickel transport system substrate-binding protein
MKRDPGALAAAAALMAALTVAGPTAAQKQGGILRAGHFDSPASMSMLEESTLAVNRPVMGVFNNLVMFDQQVAQNSPHCRGCSKDQPRSLRSTVGLHQPPPGWPSHV